MRRNPFDPAYKFDDLDEFVRNAQARNAEVLITIWGTPKWANGGKTPNFLPTSMSTFQNFTKALASRYSGRYAGYPFVRFYGIWNESNLGLFLSPQFNSAGQDRQPGRLREARRSRHRGPQGRQLEGARRDRRDLLERPQQAEGGRDRLRPAGHLRRGRRQGEQEARSSTPGRTTRTRCP